MDYAYHRLARSAPKYAWWKALVVGVIGTAIYLFLSVIYGLAIFAIGIATDPTFDGGLDSLNRLINRFTALDLADPLVFSLAVGSIALMLPSIYLARLCLGPRPIGLISSVNGRLRWGWLARCIPIAFLVYGIVFGFSFLVLDPLTGAGPVTPVVTSTTLALVLLAVILTPLQSTAEEYVFRGYLMQAIGGWLKHPAWAILLPVPLFAIGHDYDIWGLLDVSLFAIAAGYLTWRTGGLEAAIVAHVLNNTTLFVLGAFGLVDLNAKSGSAVALLSTVVLMVSYSALVVWMAKRTRLVTTRSAVLAAERIVSELPVAEPAFAAAGAEGFAPANSARSAAESEPATPRPDTAPRSDATPGYEAPPRYGERLPIVSEQSPTDSPRPPVDNTASPEQPPMDERPTS